MSKVLFINPVVREEDVPRHVPYGIALLAAIAIEQDHLVQVYDANAWRLGDVLIWDDLRVMHRGQNDFPVGEPRLMHRFLLRTIRTPEDETAEVRITARKAAGYP